MWKRLNNPKSAQRPALLDTKQNEQFSRSSGLGIITPVQSPPDRGPQPQRPQRDNSGPNGPSGLPFEPSLAPPPSFRDSKFRPASSIYSQPSPSEPSGFSRNLNAYPFASYPEEEVSPPSSPEFDGNYYRSQYQANDDEVSPIDEMPDMSKLAFSASRNEGPHSGNRPSSGSRQPASNIPILRSEKKRNNLTATAANSVTRKKVAAQPVQGRMTVDPRWDPYSGEITTSDKGKPQSVKPGTFVPPGLRSVRGESELALGNQSIISAAPAVKNHSSFGDRVRKLKLNNSIPPSERPEWKGATGRFTIVSPVADNYDIPPISVPPKSIPPKSVRRVVSPQIPQIPESTMPVSVIRDHDDQTTPATTTDPTMSAVLPNSGRKSPYVTQPPISITPDSFVVNQSAAAKTLTRGGNPTPTAPQAQHQKNDSVGTIERNFLQSLKEVGFPSVDSDPYIQPPSRFSVTTYAPSEAQSTPRPSTDNFEKPPVPKVPTPPQQSAPPQSILDRKRPKVYGSPQSQVTRKAVNMNPESPVYINMASSITSKRTSNTTKNLPMTPSEAESHDLVTSLQAQLDDLANRRDNITKSIRQMTELMPKDHVTVTEDVRRKREIEKKRIEALRIEEADVRREEHDIGLRLHRAWKRRDKDAAYEPTGLWVRRITG